MKWLKVLGGTLVALVIFTGTLYFLLSTFVKKPEAPKHLRKEFTYIYLGDTIVYETFYISPNAKLKIKLFYGDDLVYDQFYEMDKFMFRGPKDVNPAAKYHAIMAGCSFIWGEGLPLNQTFSAKFQKYNPDYQGYNLGFPGGGLHSLLRYHDFFKLTDSIKEEEGYFFYSFIPPHLDRFFARYNFLRNAPEFSPHYKVEGNKVVFKGNMKDQEIYRRFMDAKAKGLGDALINTQDPMVWDTNELRDFLVGVEELRKRYLTQFPKGKFYFLFYPTGNPTVIRDVLKVQLKERNIPYIDLEHEFGLELLSKRLKYEDVSIPHDGHPNEIANDLGAKALLKFLRKAARSQIQNS